ncbi:hypothetical protein [Peristeroidobacter soli]|jgi:hypothetical protein|uniref:hypothetical protein n=1 Tax=Peristeroidobacter soli TaxID=2497877 RepID=UPI0013007B71|nr:hypothetical protein [Peristeroidobacter soli]
MRDRGNRRRISDGGLIFITMMITILLCVLWVAASADAADAAHWAPGLLAGAPEGEQAD